MTSSSDDTTISIDEPNDNIDELLATVEKRRAEMRAAEATMERLGDAESAHALEIAQLKFQIAEIYARDKEARLRSEQARLHAEQERLHAEQERLRAELAEEENNQAILSWNQYREWYRMLDDLRLLHCRISRVLCNGFPVPSSTSLSDRSDATPPPPPWKYFQQEHRPLRCPTMEATLDDFLTHAQVAPLPPAIAAAVDGAMDTWWANARDFTPAGSSQSFGQLLLASLRRGCVRKVSKVAPVFASLMFELMRVLAVHMPSLFLFSQSKLTRSDSPWPTLADHVPSWLVDDGSDTPDVLNSSRTAFLAVFRHDAPRDVGLEFDLCASRNVRTAIRLKRRIHEQPLQEALTQLSVDYGCSVRTQYLGERSVMFGIISTGAEVRFAQIWSRSYCEARVSPVVSIATVAELETLLEPAVDELAPRQKWSDVVKSNPTFLQTIARVVLHSATVPKIDSECTLLQSECYKPIGDFERVRFERILGVTGRSIVVGAVLSKRDGTQKQVALKMDATGSDEDQCELAALTKHGGMPGVVSFVGSTAPLSNNSSWCQTVVTEPVGTAVAHMCLCSSAERRRVAGALRGGPVAALARIHESGDVFSDIHRGNVIVLPTADGGLEARFIDLASVVSSIGAKSTAAEDSARLARMIEGIEPH